MTNWETRWINRLREYWNDKKLAKKCGLEVKDICVHESDGVRYGSMLEFNNDIQPYTTYDGHNPDGLPRCKKCGEFYR